MLSFSEVPQLVRNGVQRPGDVRLLFKSNARMATISKSSAEALLGDRSLSDNWYSSPALGDQFQKSCTIRMVEIRDAKKRLVCLLPQDEWYDEGSYNVLFKGLHSLLESTKADDSASCIVSSECPSPRGSDGTPNSTSNRSQRDLPSNWSPRTPSSITEEEIESGSECDQSSDNGKLAESSAGTNSRSKRSAYSTTPSASPSDSTPEGKTLSGLALRAYRKWKESIMSDDFAEAAASRILAQSRAQQQVLERIHRTRDSGLRRDSTGRVSPTEASTAMRFWTDVRRSQKQPRQLLLDSRPDYKPLTALELLPGSDLPNRKRERLGTASKKVKFSRSVFESDSSAEPDYRTPKPLGFTRRTDSSGSKLVRSGNIAAPRRSPVPFPSLSVPGDVPDNGHSSDSGSEPSNAISLGSDDSDGGLSDQDDSDNNSESTNDTLVLDEEAAVKYDSEKFGNPKQPSRPVKKRYLRPASEEFSD